MTKATDIRLQRAYDPPGAADGTRILVDRLWPRGVSKDHLKLDHWLKDIAPSNELRHWFGHDPAKWEDFETRYRAELADNQAAVDELERLCQAGQVTLLFAAHDTAHNNAVVLAKLMRARLGG
jgi:uncharacterized protein YeaO (DUF488 family)